MTSTSAISGGGLKKCKPNTRSGCWVLAAMAVMLNDEVLLASKVSGVQIASNCLKMSRLSSSLSGAASITRAQPAQSSSLVVG